MRTAAYVGSPSSPAVAWGRRDRGVWLTCCCQINPYMSNPCHIELILTEGDEVVQKSEQVAGREPLHLSSRQRGVRVRKAITAA